MATGLRQRRVHQPEPPERVQTPVSPPAGTWVRWLHAVTLVQAAAVLAVGALLTDLEAVAIGFGFVVALALLRSRRLTTVGRVLVTLLFLNVLGWMALGTVTNVATRQGLVAVVLPAVLTATSLVGVVAAVSTFSSAARTRTTRAPVVLAGAVAVGVAGLAVAAAVATDRDVAAADVEVTAADVRFATTELEADAGTITLAFENQDLFWHTVTIDELDVDLAVPVRGTRTTTFTADPGTYAFYCRIPGHESLMTGTLTVR